MENEILDKNTLKFRRAVKDPAQGFQIVKKLINENQDRNRKDAAIQAKLNDELPWNQRELEAAGQGWRHNRSTGFMSSLTKRILPPYKQAIDQAKYLTTSKLQEDTPEAQQKTDHFRYEFTQLVRRWPKWNDLIIKINKENAIFGSATSYWSDEYDWKPSFARRDGSFFPDGCPDDAADVPLWALKQNFMINELADKLVDPEISEAAGWHIDNLVNAINKAKGENRRSASTENIRVLEDTIRETNIGSAYSEQVKVVEAYHLFVREYTGTVSHYILQAESGDLLFARLDRFGSMEDCLSLYTIEEGTGKLYGSKGAGRVLYNTHVCIEQSRNLIMDSLYLSGMYLLKASNAGKRAAAIEVTHPVCVVSKDFEVIDQKLNVNVDAFVSVDKYMSQLAEMQVGAFMPSTDWSSGEKPTASQVNYVAAIEQQIREGVVSRFYSQVMKMVYQMQKRVCSPDNIKEAERILTLEDDYGRRSVSKQMADYLVASGRAKKNLPVVDESNIPNKDAVEMCYNLLKKGLSGAEIFEIANCPPQQTTQDMTQTQAQAVSSLMASYAGNPNINQQELMKLHIAYQAGNDIAEKIMIDKEDDSVMAIATRQQLLEWPVLVGSETNPGTDVPVAPIDNHTIHMDVMMTKGQDMLTTITPEAINPVTIQAFKNIATHFKAHFDGAVQNGLKDADLKPYEEFLKKIELIMQQIDAVMAQGGGIPGAPPGAMPPAQDLMNQAGQMPSDGMMLEDNTMPSNPMPTSQMGMPLSKGPVDFGVKLGPQ